ncbi:MAG: UbiA prenyltransferase [Parcubacteria group bacterium GW2011_GWA1_38_7]|nr:MAG: UbiA prenyltransferase [Parcubacteria group bacterium GW2011_GWA1_38_7]
MSKIFIYIQERFPVAPVLLFAFGYAALATGISETPPTKILQIIVLFSGIFFFFLLRQRVVDEFKDSSHDLKNFPDRPVPRGLISKRQLVLLGLVALLLEWSCVYLLGSNSLVAYLPVFLYSLLMAKEFFISDWLNRHFNLYLLSHEVIFIFFGLFFMLVTNENLMTNSFPLVLGTLTVAPVSVEIIRKFSPRYDKKGKAVQDTYSTVWGRNVALTILILLSFFTALFLTIIKNSPYFLLLILITLCILFVMKSSDKAVKIIGAINFLGLAILANIF